MKFQVEQSALTKALAKVSGIIERRNTIPILANVVIRAEDNRLTILGTDLDIEAVTTFDARVDVQGETTVSAALLTDIVKKTPPGKELDFDLDGDHLSIKAGRSKFRLATLPSAEFPLMGAADYKSNFAIDGLELSRLIGKAAFAMSTEESRYYLNGVYLHVSDGDVTTVATDGHRLAKVTSDTQADFDGVIIPRKTVAELRKVITAGDIKVSLNDHKIRFDMGDTVITSKVIDGTFPDYRRIIPERHPNRVTVAAQDLSRAADRVSSVTEDRSRIVVFEAKDGAVTISAAGSTGQAEDVIDADIDGQDIRTGFNSAYVRETLSQADGGAVVIEYKGTGDPFIIRPTEDSRFMAILMPARVV
jgi:DNA polymerase III subunit beta